MLNKKQIGGLIPHTTIEKELGEEQLLIRLFAKRTLGD